jgi:hypothetical protein
MTYHKIDPKEGNPKIFYSDLTQTFLQHFSAQQTSSHKYSCLFVLGTLTFNIHRVLGFLLFFLFFWVQILCFFVLFFPGCQERLASSLFERGTKTTTNTQTHGNCRHRAGDASLAVTAGPTCMHLDVAFAKLYRRPELRHQPLISKSVDTCVHFMRVGPKCVELCSRWEASWGRARI